MSDGLVALSSAPSAEVAERLARLLVARGLAACVNVVEGARSFYRWKGVLQDERECLLLIKTTRERFEALRAALLAEHPYELPELIAVPMEAADAAYLEWLEASLRGDA